MPDRWVKLITTFFYIGFLPVAPGSLASAAAVGVVALLGAHLWLYGAVFVVVTVLGFLVSHRMEAIVGEKDPSCVVIDEVSGIMISFFLLPLTPAVIVTGFFLFRAFDMFKIYPACRLEQIKGGTGIMMDDIVAGIYTNLVMQIAVRAAGVI